MKIRIKSMYYISPLAAILLCGTSLGAAANEATDAIEGLFQRLRDLGATEANYVQLRDRGDTGASLSGAKVSIPITFALPDGGEFSATIEASLPETEFEGLSVGADGVEIANWSSPGTIEFQLTGKITAKGNDDKPGEVSPFRFTAKKSDIVSRGIFLPFFKPLEEDPAHPVSRYFKWIKTAMMAKVDEASVGTLEMTIDETKPGNRSVETYQHIEISKLHDGSVEKYRAGNFTSIQTFPADISVNGEDFEIRQEAASALIAGLDYKPIFRAFGILPPASEGNGTILVEAEVNGVSFKFPNGSASIRRIAMEDARINPEVVPFDLGSILDAIALGQIPEAEEEQKAHFKKALAVLDAFSLGRVQIDEIGFETPPLKGTLIAIEGRDFSYQGVERFAIRGLAANGPNLGSFELGLFKIDQLGLASLPDYVDLAFAAKDGGEPDLADILPIVPTLGGLELAGLRAAFDDLPSEISLGRYLLNMSDFIDPFPTKIRAETRGLHIPVAAIQEPDIRKLLETAGLREFIYDDKLQIGWDENTGDLTLDELSMTLKGGGTAKASLRFGGIPRRVFERPDQIQFALATATIKSGKITVSDAAIVSAFIEDQAKDAQISTDTLAFAMADQAKNSLGPLGSTEFGEEIRTALRGFLTKPDQIELIIAPERSVSLVELVGLAATAPQRIIEVLGVKVSAGKG